MLVGLYLPSDLRLGLLPVTLVVSHVMILIGTRLATRLLGLWGRPSISLGLYVCSTVSVYG